MVLSIISIALNVLIFVVLNLNLYTDRAPMPDGSVREWQRSPVSRLDIADQRYLFYLQIALSAVCAITGILVLFGVKNSIVKIIQIISLAASLIMFAVIMIVTGNTHAKYA